MDFLHQDDKEPLQNDFERALERLADGKKRTRAMNMRAQDARVQAKKLIDYMTDVRKKDNELIRTSRPASLKSASMLKVQRLIDRKGFHKSFIMEHGLTELCLWISPVEEPGKNLADRAEASHTVVEGVLTCLQALSNHTKNVDVIVSGIGKQVRRVVKNPMYPLELRKQAQNLLNDWVADVTGTRVRKDDDDEEDDVHPDDEAEEVDERGRKIRRKANQPMLPPRQQARTEQELNTIWQPKAEDQALYEERMQMRHAVMPMEKPVFDKEALPPSLAPPKKKAKEDPNSSVGKIQTQLGKISNPNKKAWKSSIDGVSISGRNIVYKW